MLTSIEINATFYGSQKPESFRKWAATVPDGFVFSVKGPRFATNRRVLAEAGDSIKRFLDSGVLELGDRLGPLLWQFAPTKKFDPADFGKFLELLPREAGRAAAAARRRSAACELLRTPNSSRLLRTFTIAGRVHRSCAPIPSIADVTGDFIYARLQKGRTRSRPPIPARSWTPGPAGCALWAQGKSPEDLPHVDAASEPKAGPRDVFAYVIHEGKVRAPAAAMALIERLGK